MTASIAARIDPQLQPDPMTQQIVVSIHSELIGRRARVRE
jgi:hypothetical protein